MTDRVSLTSASAAPVAPASDHDLTVIIPAYNEEQRLPATLDGLQEYLDDWGIDYRVLVIDNASRDQTGLITERYDSRFRTIHQPIPGKGAAIRLGMLQATGRVVAFTDADLPYDLRSLRTSYDWIAGQECDVVFGARDLDESHMIAKRKLVRMLATTVFREIVRTLVSRQVTDTQCGIKAFRREAAYDIFSRTTIDGFAFDAEVVYLTHKLTLPYRRVPVTLINEYSSTLSLSRHALPMLLDVFRLRWRSLQGKYRLSTYLAGETQFADLRESTRKAA